MIRLRRCWRVAPAQNQTRSDAEIVLASVGTDRGAGKVAHEIVGFKDAPCQVLQKHGINTAAGRQPEGRLGGGAGKLRTRVYRAKQHFAERHEVVEAPQVDSRPE